MPNTLSTKLPLHPAMHNTLSTKLPLHPTMALNPVVRPRTCINKTVSLLQFFAENNLNLKQSGMGRNNCCRFHRYTKMFLVLLGAVLLYRLVSVGYQRLQPYRAVPTLYQTSVITSKPVLGQALEDHKAPKVLSQNDTKVTELDEFREILLLTLRWAGVHTSMTDPISFSIVGVKGMLVIPFWCLMPYPWSFCLENVMIKIF